MDNVKLVLHIDETEKWNLVLMNAENVLKELEGKEFDFEIVAYHDAITMYTERDGEYADRLKKVADAGVVIAACNNSMKKKNITKEMMFDFITVVPSGVMELVKLQNEGFAYVRP